ncbi:MAG TPA: tetratricopeptide repeat protein, partial [Gammaproteobacteria bacterium]|nr:tetratricopeptide repeat protein [Gammaproteobacteria bacterium]
ALLSDHRGDEASLKRAAELANVLEKTNQPAFVDTAGWVYYRNGDYARAVELLQQVVDKMPDVAIFNYHLGMALAKQGDKETARKYLEKAVNSDQDFTGKDEARDTLESL